MTEYADIALIRHSKITDQLYTYALPDHVSGDVRVGSRVIVSFGRGDGPVEGYVIYRHSTKPAYSTKPIRAVFEGSGHLTEAQIALCCWLRQETHCTWTEALLTLIPSGTVLKRTVYWHENASCEMALSLDETQMLNRLKSNGGNVDSLNPEDQKLGLKLKRKGILTESEAFTAPVQEKQQTMYVAAGTEDQLQQAFKRAGKSMAMYREILKYVALVGPVSLREIKTALGAEARHVNILKEKGLLVGSQVREERVPLMLTHEGSEGFQTLSQTQKSAVERICASPPGSTWLLHGVTGSGKTEVYLYLVREALSTGKTAIVLVPEIALTPQITGRFLRRFGNRVAVLHSRLSPGERLDQWDRISRGESTVVIGPRSAIFAPLSNLGLIIMDEEHDSAYKSESAPRYNTRDVAQWLNAQCGGQLVLGSATPSVEVYYAAKKGSIQLCQLPERINALPMPEVSLVDMREELLAGNRQIISRALNEAIRDRLSRNEQVLILLNKKGYSSSLACRSCGFLLKCPKCDIGMTYFKGAEHARCSYCGFASAAEKTCPSCHSSEYYPVGTGTERLEETLTACYPGARIDRMDAESTSRKGTLEGIIERVEQGQTDILLGTQMIAKGLHFPGVTLVGILSADIALNFPDYKANERAFQLLTQVSGRTGRGDKPGTVIIQTYRPDHYAIASSAAQDYGGFFKSEIMLRKAFRYPPYVEMVNLTLQGESEETILKEAKGLYNRIGNALKTTGATFQLLGPHPAAFPKIRGVWRYQILMKFLNRDSVSVTAVLEGIRRETMPGVNLIIDPKPVTTL